MILWRTWLIEANNEYMFRGRIPTVMQVLFSPVKFILIIYSLLYCYLILPVANAIN